MSTRRPLYGWLTAEAVSLTGTRISMIALPWFVLTTTGSPTLTGLVALAEMAPMVAFKVLGGPVIDRLGPRRVSIACDLGSLVVVGLVPLLHVAGVLSFPTLLALVAVAGALRGPGDAAKHALIPTLVAQAGVAMERATGLASTVERTASMLGAALAGGLVALVGPTYALAVDAASFGVAAVVLAWSTRSLVSTGSTSVSPGVDPGVSTGSTSVSPGVDPGVSTGSTTGSGYLSQLREGWAFLRGDRVLLGIAVMVALTNLLDVAWFSVMVPVWAKEYGGGAAAIGILFAVFSGASVLGATCAATWGHRLPRYRTYLLAFLVGGAPRYVATAFDIPFAWVLGVAVVGGFAAGFINPVLGAVVFERIPAPLVGRVTSLSTSMAFALMPFGGLLGGGLIAAVGLPAAMLAVGAAYLAATMLPALDARWREMDRRPATMNRDTGTSDETVSETSPQPA